MGTKFTKGEWTIGKGSWADGHVDINSDCWKALAVVVVSEEGGCRDEEGVANSNLIASAPKLYTTLDNLLNEILDLMGESDGVYGLHLNGDESPWGELEEGGRFERLTSISEAIDVLKMARGEEVK